MIDVVEAFGFPPVIDPPTMDNIVPNPDGVHEGYRLAPQGGSRGSVGEIGCVIQK